jgi:hypothetical protein
MRDINSHGGKHVNLRTRKLAVFVTCLGVAAAFPVLSSADRGGKPQSNNGNNHGKACPGKGKGRIHKKKPAPNHKGKKCGFAPLVTGTTTITIPTTTTTGGAAPTGSTTSTTQSTPSTTSSTVSTTSGM